MALLNDLKAVRELLSKPERWTQGDEAQDADGCGVDALSESAVCWCIVGAAHRALPGALSIDDRAVLTVAIERQIGAGTIADWNDAPDRTHAEVLALLDRAIEVESKKQGAAK